MAEFLLLEAEVDHDTIEDTESSEDDWSTFIDDELEGSGEPVASSQPGITFEEEYAECQSILEKLRLRSRHVSYTDSNINASVPGSLEYDLATTFLRDSVLNRDTSSQLVEGTLTTFDIFLLRVPYRTEQHILELLQRVPADVHAVGFRLPATSKTIYVEASSPDVIKRILRSSPYTSDIQLNHVPKVEVSCLLKYLQRPSCLRPFSWVRIRLSRNYKGDIALLSKEHRMLILPRYRPKDLDKSSRNRRFDKLTVIPDAERYLVSLDGCFGLPLLSTQELMSVDVVYMVHKVEPVDTLDRVFLESVYRFLVAGVPDAFVAWNRIWKKLWRPGCSVRSSTGTIGTLASVEDDDTAMVQFGNGDIAATRISALVRDFVPGQSFVVAFGCYAGCLGVVLRVCSDTDVIWQKLHDNKPVDVEVQIPCYYLLDADPHASLFSLHVESRPQASFIAQAHPREDVIISGGHYKGYHGSVIDVDDDHGVVTVEIAGLVGAKHRKISSHQTMPTSVSNISDVFVRETTPLPSGEELASATGDFVITPDDHIPVQCQYLLSDVFWSEIEKEGVSRTLVRITMEHDRGQFHNRIGVVEKPVLTLQPTAPHNDYIPVSTTDSKGRSVLLSVDVRHLQPAPPAKKNQRFVVLSATGELSLGGILIAAKVERVKEQVAVWRGSRGHNEVYPLNVCVCVLSEGEII